MLVTINTVQRVCVRGENEFILIYIETKNGGIWKTLEDFEELNENLDELNLRKVEIPSTNCLLVNGAKRKELAKELEQSFRQVLGNNQGSKLMGSFLGVKHDLFLKKALAFLIQRGIGRTMFVIQQSQSSLRKRVGQIVAGLFVLFLIIRKKAAGYLLGGCALGLGVGGLIYENDLKRLLTRSISDAQAASRGMEKSFTKQDQSTEEKDVNLVVKLLSPEEAPEQSEEQIKLDQELTKKLDNLDNTEKFVEECELALKHYDDAKERRSFELIWRISRALYMGAEMIRQEKGETDPEKIRLIERALELTHCLIEWFPNESISHKYHAICAQENSNHRGTKEKITAGYEFQQHTLKAIEMDPKDATLQYMMGRFSFEVSKLSWAERMAARAIFGQDPPKTTIDEALIYFEKACQFREGGPQFRDLLELGRCNIQAGNKQKGKQALEKILARDPLKDSYDDKEVRLEAQALIKKC